MTDIGGGVASHPTGAEGAGTSPVDWEQFAARLPAGRGRHDLRAVGAYGAYRRRVEALPGDDARRALQDDDLRVALRVWDSEGGRQGRPSSPLRR